MPLVTVSLGSRRPTTSGDARFTVPTQPPLFPVAMMYPVVLANSGGLMLFSSTSVDVRTLMLSAIAHRKNQCVPTQEPTDHEPHRPARHRKSANLQLFPPPGTRQ